jgi:hypothetical protein
VVVILGWEIQLGVEVDEEQVDMGCRGDGWIVEETGADGGGFGSDTQKKLSFE